jgi:hypothetical protein
MTTRTRKTWKLDSQGHYARQIGWKRGRNGARVQHKFRLGADLNEARRRDQKLREVWEAIERSSPNAVWAPFLLGAAKRIARGETDVVLPREQGETEIAYAQRVKNLETLLPVVRVVPSDVEAYSQGRRQWGDRDRRPIRLSAVPPDFFDNEIVVVGNGGGPMRRAREQAAASTGRLHQAMQDYIAWIKEDFFRPQLGRITDNGQTRIRKVNTLLSRHEDISLVDLDYEAAERMFRYWRQRPPKKDRVYQSARNQLRITLANCDGFSPGCIGQAAIPGESPKTSTTSTSPWTETCPVSRKGWCTRRCLRWTS